MSGAQRPGPPGPGPTDEVARFFAHERSLVQDVGADDLGWQVVVRATRARRRNRFLSYAAATAAALLAALAVVAWPTAPEAPVRPAGAGDVPVSFVARSLSVAGAGTVYLLGTSDCPAGSCPTLAVSSDGGASWSTRTIFRAGDGDGDRDGDMLAGVHFATRDLGWVWGSELMVTRDGGRSWTDVPHPGEVVLDLDSNDAEVVLTSTGDCAAGSCAGPLQVTRAPVASDDLTAPTVSAPAPAALADAPVHVGGQDAYVVPLPAAGEAGPGDGTAAPGTGERVGPFRVGPGSVEAGRIEQMAAPVGCASAPQDVSVVPGRPGELFAVCAIGSPVDGSGGATGRSFEVSSSPNGGRVWTPVSSELVLGADAAGLVAVDQVTLLAVGTEAVGDDTGGAADLEAATVQVSHDGGRSWQDPSVPPPAPAGGWRQGAAGEDGALYLLSGADATYWVSRDAGDTWQQGDPRQASAMLTP